MHDLFSTSVMIQLLLLLATLVAFALGGFKINPWVWGTYTFANVYQINDEEEWSVVSELTDTTGVITFKNPDFLTPPRVHVKHTAQSSYLNQFCITNVTGVNCTISQTVSIGAGACHVIVRRRASSV